MPTGTNARNQTELLQNELLDQNNLVTDTLKTPGIENLHEKSKEELASVLANLVKSRTGIVKLTYVVGSHIEIVSDGNPHKQLRD